MQPRPKVPIKITPNAGAFQNEVDSKPAPLKSIKDAASEIQKRFKTGQRSGHRLKPIPLRGILF